VNDAAYGIDLGFAGNAPVGQLDAHECVPELPEARPAVASSR
jgi:hypothetical protein